MIRFRLEDERIQSTRDVIFMRYDITDLASHRSWHRPLHRRRQHSRPCCLAAEPLAEGGVDDAEVVDVTPVSRSRTPRGGKIDDAEAVDVASGGCLSLAYRIIVCASPSRALLGGEVDDAEVVDVTPVSCSRTPRGGKADDAEAVDVASGGCLSPA